MTSSACAKAKPSDSLISGSSSTMSKSGFAAVKRQCIPDEILFDYSLGPSLGWWVILLKSLNFS
jgi:hypothetical protein